MSKMNINLTNESEIVLSEVKTKALKLGVDVSNKEKLVNYALELLGESLTNS